MEIGERLREARKKSGMTQDQIAEQIMVSRVTVSHWENGKTLPDVASLISLSDLYNVSLDELLKGDPKMEEKVKKDAKNLRNNKRLLLTIGTLCLLLGCIYCITWCVGGDFKDFCEAASPWILIGIGLAAWTTYSAQLEKKGTEPSEKTDEIRR